eukprot:TRINITY_DN1039_c0_g3_i1.p1 TRINITY_DN1039_c0_g3~~TRINITY_DN1039_c0_g3_i1.p1  ORF type:complete len:914 (+),score=303.35 TRINITY_DN1039_c0_g3_i1:407-2743(+)
MYTVSNFIKDALECDLLRLSDDIVYKKRPECSCNIVEADGKYLIKDEQTGNDFPSLNQWAIQCFDDKSKNIQKCSFRKREGKFEAIYSIIARLCELKAKASAPKTETPKPTKPKVVTEPCGICSQKITNSHVRCSAPKKYKQKGCKEVVHPKCLGLTDATQINKDHIWLCEACFVPYVNKVESVNIKQYIRSNADSLRSLRNEKQTLRAILPRILAEGPCDTCMLDDEGELTEVQAGISHYSYRNTAKHKSWLQDIVGGLLEMSAKAVSECIDLDDDDEDEQIDKDAKVMAARLLKDPPSKYTPVPVASLRVFKGKMERFYQNGSSEVSFKPPDNKATIFFDCLQGDRIPLNWYIYFQRVDGNLSLVFWPGSDKHAQAIKVSDLLDFRGAFDGEDVYMHFTSDNAALASLAPSTRELLRRKQAEKSHPAMSAPIALRDKGEASAPIHLTMICQTPLSGGKEKRTRSRVATKATHFMLEELMKETMKNAPRSLKSLGEEICWMQTETKELLGLNQTLFTYAPSTPLDKGYVTLDDYDRLRDKRFLNGECINFYLHHLSKIHKDVCVFPTHFFTKVKQMFDPCNSSSSKRHLEWVTKSENLPASLTSSSVSAYRALVVPINDPRRHWVLGVVTDLDKVKTGGAPVLKNYDSFNKPDNMGFQSAMAKFLAYRYAAEEAPSGATCEKYWDAFGKNGGKKSCTVPQQENQTECGVHVLHMASLLMKQGNISSFTTDDAWFKAEKDIPKLRREIKAVVHKLTSESAPELLPKLAQLDIEHQKKN